MGRQPAAEEFLSKVVPGTPELAGNDARDLRDCPGPDRPVARDSEVTLATVNHGEELHVATGLMESVRTRTRQTGDQFVPGNIARKPHAEMTSSLTRWSRMIAGPLPLAK